MEDHCKEFGHLTHLDCLYSSSKIDFPIVSNSPVFEEFDCKTLLVSLTENNFLPLRKPSSHDSLRQTPHSLAHQAGGPVLYGLLLHPLPCEVCLQGFHGPASNLILYCNISFVEESDLSDFPLIPLEPEVEDLLRSLLEEVCVDIAVVDLVPGLAPPCSQGACHQARRVLALEECNSSVLNVLNTPHLVEAQPRLSVAQRSTEKLETDSP